MKMLSFEKFADDFGRAVKPTMDMSIYMDNFQCSCGKSHWLDGSIDIICEGFMKVMVICPNDSSYLTSLKIKTFMIVKFKGLESLAGTHLENQNEKDALRLMQIAFRG